MNFFFYIEAKSENKNGGGCMGAGAWGAVGGFKVNFFLGTPVAPVNF